MRVHYRHNNGSLAAALLVALVFLACSSPDKGTAPFMEMVPIQGGTFTMGSPETEVASQSNERPQRQVTVSSFSMGKYPVTQGQYQAVMGALPSGLPFSNYGAGDNYPVYYVSWYDTIVFCNKLSIKEGLDPAYSISESTDPAVWGPVPTSNNTTWNKVEIVAGSNGYRLPTEAQWGYACRAGTVTPFSTGHIITTSQANYNGNYPYGNNPAGIYRERTTPVGSFAPNAWGLYDMHGNVFEWCWDWYGTYPSVAETDPIGPDSGTSRVRRGGAWDYYGQYLRSDYRNASYPGGRYLLVGFRVARLGTPAE